MKQVEYWGAVGGRDKSCCTMTYVNSRVITVTIPYGDWLRCEDLHLSQGYNVYGVHILRDACVAMCNCVTRSEIS